MDWHQRFRAYFPLALQKAYACQAYSSPMSPEVSEAVAVFFDRLTHGRSDKPEWLAAAQSVRRQVAHLIHAEAGQIAFTKNTTEGLNLVAQGYPWQPGDNLVIDDQEHPVNVVPWLNLRHRGVEVRVAATEDHRITVDALWQRVDARTRIVAVSHAQYGTGFRIDLQALGERCRNAGITLVVDGIQTVGLLPVDVQAWGISALACGAYKALHGPLGCWSVCTQLIWAPRPSTRWTATRRAGPCVAATCTMRAGSKAATSTTRPSMAWPAPCC